MEFRLRLQTTSSVLVVLSSQTFICVISFYPLQSICYLPFPRTFTYSIPPYGISSCSYYLHGTSRAFEPHNLDLYLSCSLSPISVSLRILAQPTIYILY
jgi:hypothetical protein